MAQDHIRDAAAFLQNAKPNVNLQNLEDTRAAQQRRIAEEQELLRQETELYEREKELREKAEREAIEQSRLGRLEQDRMLQEERQKIENERMEQQRAQLERQQKQEREIAERRQNSSSPKPASAVQAQVPQIPVQSNSQSNSQPNPQPESKPQQKKLYDFAICFMSTVPNEQVRLLENTLLSAGVDKHDIQIQDISQDSELSGYITDCISDCQDKVEYPILFFNRTFIGGIPQVVKFLETDWKNPQPAEKDKDFDADFEKIESRSEIPAQGYISGGLEVVENLLSSLNPLAWFGSSQLGSAQPNVPQFELLVTNWYFRQQKRIFRFYDIAFSRIQPRSGDVRATTPYTTIKSLEVVDGQNIILHYDSQVPADYLCGSSPDITQIVTILRSKGIK